MTPAVKAIVIANVAVFLSHVPDGRFRRVAVDLGLSRSVAEGRVRRRPDLAAGRPTSSCTTPPASCTSSSTCWRSGCSALTSSVAGARAVREVLLGHRHRRRRRHGAGVAAAVRGLARHLQRHDDWRLGRHLRTADARGRCCSRIGRCCSCSSFRCRRAWRPRSWARWRFSRPSLDATDRWPKPHTSAGLVVGWFYLKGPTSLRLRFSTGSRSGEWTACARSSTSTRGGRGDGGRELCTIH